MCHRKRFTVRCSVFGSASSGVSSFRALLDTEQHRRLYPQLGGRPSAMASVTCRVQYLEDSDPFICTNFPEPRRPPTVSLEENLPLSEQISGIHKLLEAPLKLEECTLQLSPNGNYLDLDASLSEQRDELESFYEDVTKGKKPILILRTQLSVRVHSILEKLYNSHGPELRRSLFSLKQLFQDDKDLVPEFVASEGLTCFIKVGAEADHNYQNYILRGEFPVDLNCRREN
ncbi:FH1/FH2 domain-containing protein 1-like [Thunnus maccoyii]|uniref:FH1/FH2 domain-containing protein 1-like n=1 Tax=Thunnus maccoyii TaxID=8240 RepID=UPI001C4BABFA|nr:FH1/FH2 domain-containing protein 1-like [Thunnus maccoyii]